MLYFCVFNVFILFNSFETERGELCRDPKQRWVKEKVKQFKLKYAET